MVVILNDYLFFQLMVVVVKGNDYYLSIDCFVYLLVVYEDFQLVQVFKVWMLVWLLEMMIGDFDELNLNVQQVVYFIEVCYCGVWIFNKQLFFYQDDFLVCWVCQVVMVNLIIINYVYLVVYFVELGGDDWGVFLVVDEVQYLSWVVFC